MFRVITAVFMTGLSFVAALISAASTSSLTSGVAVWAILTLIGNYIALYLYEE